jgi:hypothetical protein
VNDTKLNLLIQALPEDFDYQKKHIPNLTKSLMLKIRGTGLGLYTFRFYELFDRGNDVFFCRVESLRSDLIAFFEKIGVANDALRTYVFDLGKKNISEHDHYSIYYTTELADLVFTRDRELVERFGYTFENKAQKHERSVPA